MNDQVDFLTRAEVAAMLRVSIHTLNRWGQQGEGPKGIRLGPRRVVYRRSDVLSFLEGVTSQPVVGLA